MLLKRKIHLPEKDSCFLAIDVPRDNEKGAIVMEQVLAAIHGLDARVSFEIWSTREKIQLALWCLRIHRDFIIHQVESHYHGVYIREKEDFVLGMEKFDTACLGLYASPIFPIRRYSQTADVMNSSWTDPFLGILGTLKVKYPEDVRGVQVIFMPISSSWRKRGMETLKVYERMASWWLFKKSWWARDCFFRGVYSSWWLRFFLTSFLSDKPAPKFISHDSEKIDHRGHFRESAGEAARAKLSQIGFSVSVRMVHQGRGSEAKNALRQIASSFAQFTIAELNGFRIQKMNRGSRKRLSSRQADCSMHLSVEELAGILALPTRQSQIPELARVEFKVMPCLFDEKCRDGIVIGTEISRESENKVLRLSADDLKTHASVIGKTGSGKSTLILSIIHSLMHKGQGVGVVDPHGDLGNAVLEVIPENRIKDTILIDPGDIDYPVAFNVLQASVGRKEQIASAVVDAFQKLFQSNWGPRTEYILSQSVAALVFLPGASLLGIPKILLDSHYRKYCLRHVKDPLLRHFWLNEYQTMPARLRIEAIGPILNKINRFLMVPTMRNMLGQRQNRLPLREMMDSRQILIVNLAKGILGEENSTLLGNLLLAHIQLAAFSRADLPQSKRVPFSLFVDELQHFTSSTTSHIAAILSEGRKYRLNLIMACQHISQLESLANSVFGNVGTLISFGVGHDDAGKISPYLSEVEAEDLLNLPAYHGYLRLTRAHRHHVVSFKTMPFEQGGREDVVEDVRKHSRACYGRPRREVEKEIDVFFQETKDIPMP